MWKKHSYFGYSYKEVNMEHPTFKIEWPKNYTLKFENRDELQNIKDKLNLTKRSIWIEHEDKSGIYVEMSMATMEKVEKLKNEEKRSNVGG